LLFVLLAERSPHNRSHFDAQDKNVLRAYRARALLDLIRGECAKADSTEQLDRRDDLRLSGAYLFTCGSALAAEEIRRRIPCKDVKPPFPSSLRRHSVVFEDVCRARAP
jgi:hypothetical protein